MITPTIAATSNFRRRVADGICRGRLGVAISWISVEGSRRAAGIIIALCSLGGGWAGQQTYKQTNKRTNQPTRLRRLLANAVGASWTPTLWLRTRTHCRDNMSPWPGTAAWGSSRRSWKAVLVGGRFGTSGTACCHRSTIFIFLLFSLPTRGKIQLQASKDLEAQRCTGEQVRVKSPPESFSC